MKFVKFGFLLLTILISNSIFSESYPNKIKIGILSKYSPRDLRIQSTGSRILYGNKNSLEKNKTLILRSEKDKIHILNGSENFLNDHILFSGGEYEIQIPKEDTIRKYSGDLEISSKNGILKIILTVPLEEYVRIGTVSEFGDLFYPKKEKISNQNWKSEYWTVSSAMIRSYALSNLGRHSKEGHDLCDLTHCLQFSGKLSKENSIQTSSKRILLTDKGGKSLETFFHSTCGGNLSSPSVLWKNFRNANNYRSGRDIWKSGEILCKNSPYSSWETFLSKEDLENIFETKQFNELEAKYSENRVSSINYQDHSGKKNIQVSEFLSKIGKKFGWNRTRSNDFKIEKSTNGFYLKGKGFGHGTGLCQYGAREMSFQGAKANEILLFYFPGAELKELP
ncbi:SpoIID/LytB domain-containing protein [Leptospira sarikeiensis]|uniref:SpoIID/LytB domain-containing protein n=1 Tax=Leptospira sarikeiensis TaxID=2484943 RepID=A0A4R9K448_9LEPT|nr:SpoIID/LytB domain-containing protein [Leptospira sarikeiensis]TGL60866.1 SpoIID/LytB domain-containing protein [Leptospira sarikeiensis]